MKKLISISLFLMIGCQKPCEVCKDCTWDNELSWALSVEGQECMYTNENDKCSNYLNGDIDGFDFVKVRKIVVTDIQDRQFILNVVPGGEYEQIFEMGYEFVKYKKMFEDEKNNLN